jgi:HAMP domain-containing protein
MVETTVRTTRWQSVSCAGRNACLVHALSYSVAAVILAGTPWVEPAALGPLTAAATDSAAEFLRTRCVTLLSQARVAAGQLQLQELRQKLEAAKAAVPKNFALVGSLGRELKAAEEACATGGAAGPLLPAGELQELAARKAALVAELQAHCEQLEQQEDFAALEDLGQVLWELSELTL